MGPSYRIVRTRSTAGEFHARAVPTPPAAEVWWHEVTRPALVLGSTQLDQTVDREACRRAGVDVVRRRSGGGAVLLEPGAVHWIDVIVPRGSPGWTTDVHGSMRWLGAHVAATLVDDIGIGAARVAVHDGPMTATPWSTTVCFDGIGAGEVLLDGTKLVGISQRRTRDAARLQCCWYSSYDPTALVELLDIAHRPAVGDLHPVATLPFDAAVDLPTRLLGRLNA